jgi:hypothetical protein
MVYTRIIPGKNGFSQLQISSRLVLLYRALKRPGKNGRRDRIQCVYFGFDTEHQAAEFAYKLRAKHSQVRLVVREAERLLEVPYEVKVWEFDHLMHLVFTCAEKTKLEATPAVA